MLCGRFVLYVPYRATFTIAPPFSQADCSTLLLNPRLILPTPTYLHPSQEFKQICLCRAYTILSSHHPRISQPLARFNIFHNIRLHHQPSIFSQRYPFTHCSQVYIIQVRNGPRDSFRSRSQRTEETAWVFFPVLSTRTGSLTLTRRMQKRRSTLSH